MAFHIVTSRCFLVCDKVTSVVVEFPDAASEQNMMPVSKLKPKISKKVAKKVVSSQEIEQCVIKISYYPLTRTKAGGANNNRSDDYTENVLDLNIVGKELALSLYAEIIREIQEQSCDEGYLDKIVDKILREPDFQEKE